jgi:ribulose-5-phosphate 4-epimerase/fuculose-1-phosphate aldolase
MEPGKPSKEISFHAAIYAARPEVGAVVHLHSPFGLMLGMFEELDQDDFLPPCTPYAVSRVGRVPVVEYYTPGSQILAQRVRERTGQAGNAIYLAKHGVITFASNLGRAADIAEEFELTARLYVLTGGRIPLLSTAEVKELRGKDEKKA